MTISRKTFFIFLGIILICFFYIAFNATNKKTIISPNVLLLTNPVMNFCGKVQKIEPEALWLTRTVYTQKNLSAPLEKNALTYKVIIDEQTRMQYLFPAIPYLFKSKSEPGPMYIKPEMSKFKIGQVVNVTSREDLRRYPQDAFIAEFVYLQPVTNSVFGIISQVQSDRLFLKALEPPMLPFVQPDNRANDQPGHPQEMLFTVQLNPDTEISKLDSSNPSRPKPVKLDFSALKAGLPVTVYTDVDVSQEGAITALLIQPKMETIPQKNNLGGIFPPLMPQDKTNYKTRDMKL